VEAERQGIKADRKMLYIGLEPANEHVAATLRVEPGQDVVARRKLMFAKRCPRPDSHIVRPRRSVRRHPDGRTGVRPAIPSGRH
jgi:hypothetical protein